MGGKEKRPCKGCANEDGTIKIKLGDGREVFLGPKCYEQAMKTSTWGVLGKEKPAP